MSNKHHYLKLETIFYQHVENGAKRFEIRKNDKDYMKYDLVYFKEVVGGVETGRESKQYTIEYVLDSKAGGKYGLGEGYCIFGFK